MGFVLDGIQPDTYDRTYRDAALVRRMLPYFRAHRRTTATIIGLITVTSLTGVLISLATSRGIDAIGSQGMLAHVLGAALAVALFGLLNWWFTYQQQFLTSTIVADVVRLVRKDAFDATMQRDMSFFDDTRSGKIVSRITTDTQSFGSVVSLTVNLISQILLVTIIAVVLLMIEPRMAAITLATAPLVLLVALLFRAAARWVTQQAQRATAEVNATIQETISGIGVAKSFRQEQAVYDAFRRTNRMTYRVQLWRGWVFDTIFPALDILTAIGLALVIYYGGLRVIGGTISTGDWYLFVQSLAVFYFPLTGIASFWSQFQLGLGASERIFSLIDTEPRVMQTAEQPVETLKGRITVAQVDFAYRPNEPVLASFSLDIPAGQRVAIVGHTGAGKSSLLKLIARAYEFQGGRLLIDGRDIRTLDLASYRSKLGVVPQSPFLFAGTLADNIRYGRPDATDADVAAVVRQLDGGRWLAALPQGLATPVGERGARLSLGQRQLVALCRVLLQDAPVVLLDEATASIDPLTESSIQDALDVVLRNRTSISIAHRLSTVVAADRIIVLDRGVIKEEGTHAALLRLGGQYAELYHTYFRHQSLEYVEQAGR